MSEEAALYGDEDAVAPGEDYEGAALYSDEAAAPQSERGQTDTANGETETDEADALHYQTDDYATHAQTQRGAAAAQPSQSQQPSQQQQQSQRSGSASQFSKASSPHSGSFPSVSVPSQQAAAGINPLSVYVENLPVPLSEADLRSHFSPYGSITTTKLNINMQTGDQLGYGFVEYGTEEEAKRAVDGANGSVMRGRTLRARFATARGARRERDPHMANHAAAAAAAARGPLGAAAAGLGAAGAGGAGGMGGSDKPIDNCNLYVAGLPWSWTQQDVEQCFSAFGAITDSKLLINLQTKESKGVAFVKLDSEANAQRAIATLNGKQMDGGTVLQVRVAHKNEKKGPMGGGGMGGMAGTGGGMGLGPGGMGGASRMAGGLGGMVRGGPGMGGGDGRRDGRDGRRDRYGWHGRDGNGWRNDGRNGRHGWNEQYGSDGSDESDGSDGPDGHGRRHGRYGRHGRHGRYWEYGQYGHGRDGRRDGRDGHGRHGHGRDGWNGDGLCSEQRWRLRRNAWYHSRRQSLQSIGGGRRRRRRRRRRVG